MGSPIENDLEHLYKYAMGSKFIIETGGGGKSTYYLAQAAIESGAKMICIEANKNRINPIDGVEYMIGWSVRYEDIIKPGHPKFVGSRYKTIDRKVAHCRFRWLAHLYMSGEKDLIRKALKKYDIPLDFFFCDTGEYCGLAEWNIVKDVIKIGGYFAAHDIYYPKSIKCYQVATEIENSDAWEVLLKTESVQGLLIARRVK